MTTATTLKMEVHRYAPELNKVHLTNGVVIAAPSYKSVAAWRAARKPGKSRAYAWVSLVYPEPWKHLSRCVASGTVLARKDALKVAHYWREREKGGTLLDGTNLPAPKVVIKTVLIG